MNTRIVSLILTNRCHRRCPDCAVAAWQAPDLRDVSWSVLKDFVAAHTAHPFKFIKFFGGEPTLHAEFLKVINFVRAACGSKPKYILFSTLERDDLPKWLRRVKTRPAEDHEPFFMAPCDNLKCDLTRVNEGCWRLAQCGVALNVDGLWYPCTSGMAIDRVFKFGLGFASLDELLASDLTDELYHYCSLCGLYGNSKWVRGRVVAKRRSQHDISPSWEIALKEYNESFLDL